MYRWYSDAAKCYLYLYDVHQNSALGRGDGKPSELFERGWTLQELLAPKKVALYDQDWNCLGTKHSLAATISEITRIDAEVLKGQSASDRSIAQRMSWAAGRKTTRIEDRAYSLLGLFGVFMPILYGEGAHAFYRLQKEIISECDDHTIFAWHMRQGQLCSGLLSQSPDDFWTCGDIGRHHATPPGDSSFSMTNKGLSIRLRSIPWKVDTYLVRLTCSTHNDQVLGVYLRRLAQDGQYARVMVEGESLTPIKLSLTDEDDPKELLEWRHFYVKKEMRQEDHNLVVEDQINGFRLIPGQSLARNRFCWKSHEFWGDGKYYARTGIVTFDKIYCFADKTGPARYLSPTWCMIDLADDKMAFQAIYLSFDSEFCPVCVLTTTYKVADILGKRGTGFFDKSGHFHIREPFRTCDADASPPSAIFGSAQGGVRLVWNEPIHGRTHQDAYPEGFWAMRADPRKGLWVALRGLAELHISQKQYGSKRVWTVELDDSIEWDKLCKTDDMLDNNLGV